MRRRTLLLAAVGTVLRPAVALAGKAAQGLFVHDHPRDLPPLDIRDADGRLAALPAGKPTILNLWASWCLPCVAELPSLDRLKELVSNDGIEVIALSLDRTGAAAVRGAYGRIGITALDIRYDDTRRAAEALAATVLPVTLLVDAGGREIARFVGPATWDSVQGVELVRSLAAGRPLSPTMAPPFAKHKGTAP